MLQNRYQNKLIEAGCDEAGRGPLAGPVVGAAVILPNNFSSSELTDSKQLSAKKRVQLSKLIKQEALSWGVGQASEQEIDEMNILNASYLAIHRAIGKLSIQPEFIVMDGNRFKPYQEIPFQSIVKGDAQYLHIAAASILAKVHRDEYMQKLHKAFPNYAWDRNKGYPTKQHRAAIKKHGPCKHHRHSFQLLPVKQEELF